MVAGQHYDADAVASERTNGFGRGWFEGIGEDKSARVPAIDCNAHAGATRHGGVQERLLRIGERSGLNHQCSVADGDSPAIDFALDSLPWEVGEVSGLGQLHLAVQSALHDRRTQRMFAGAFQAGGETKEFIGIGWCLWRRSSGRKRSQLWLALSERAGFVDDEGVDFF